MRIKTDHLVYKSVKVDGWTTGPGTTLRLTLVSLNEYAVELTPEQARRIAYALLLGADGHSPDNPRAK